MAQPAVQRLSYADYLELERSSEVKHSWLDGEILAMAGGSLAHSLIAANLGGALFAQLRGTPCRVYNADGRLRSAATGLATYPDLSVACGRPDTHPEDPQAITNPVVVVEVLSPTTEKDDRGWKLPHYRSMPSVQHILLVHQSTRLVEHFCRLEDGSWRVTDRRAGQDVGLDAVGVTLQVDEAYEGVDLLDEGGGAG